MNRAARLLLLTISAWALALLCGGLYFAADVADQKINVRWAPSATDDDRLTLEQTFGLVTVEHVGERTWLYLPTDRSRANLSRLVSHPLVEDTQHIDRAAFTIEMDRPDLPIWRVTLDEIGHLDVLAWIFGLVGLFPAWIFCRRNRSESLLLLTAVAWIFALMLGAVNVLTVVGGQQVNIRWAQTATNDDRLKLEQSFKLVAPEPVGPRTWRYVLTDRSRANLSRLVTHLLVEDTQHIDRTAFKVILDRPDLPPWRIWLAETEQLGATASLLAWLFGVAGLIPAWLWRRAISEAGASSVQTDANKRIVHWVTVGFVIAIAFVELLRTTWVGDDAAITMRSVLNLTHGLGARFNIDERVQSFTSPLWFLLLSGLSVITTNVFVSVFVLSISTSLAVLWLLMMKVARTSWGGVFAAAVLLLSKAYVDFASSGLENPLSHLLLVLAFLAGSRAIARDETRDSDSATRMFFLTGSFVYLSRPDLVLLLAPLAAWISLRSHRSVTSLARSLAVGAMPAVLWTLFSLYYYGFPFPNTAYAKLGTGIPYDERIHQGLLYLWDSLRRDSVTLRCIVIGMAVALQQDVLDRMLALGGILYMAYVVSIGGDFMTGRLLTAPMVLMACVLARASWSVWQRRTAVMVLGLLALTNLPSTILSGRNFDDKIIADDGIADERGYYFQEHGLIQAREKNRFNSFDDPDWTVRPPLPPFVTCGGLGYIGLNVGPGTHVIDTCALADPLLAHLPAVHVERWRIGHFERQLPTNYEESIAQGENRLADERTRNYYESIRLITRGELNSTVRLKEIVRMNLGLVPLPDWNMYYRTIVPRSLPAR